MPWDPDQYLKFQNERFAPFDDLLTLVTVRRGLRVIDLGCGTGQITRRLADHLPDSDGLGIDSSPAMLARAQAESRLGLRFAQKAIEEVEGQWDLVFSNAALQWVDDHLALIPRLLSLVRPGGQLVVQVPSNHGHSTHRLLLELAGQAPFRDGLGGWVRPSPVLTIDAYADLLHAHGGRDLTVMEKVYPHVLPDADALVEWMSGTGLVPYLERLPGELQDPFVSTYRERLRKRWPEGPVFYGFRRILFAATRA